MSSEEYKKLELCPFTQKEFILDKKIDPIRFNLQKDGREVTLVVVSDAAQLPNELNKLLWQEFNKIVDEGLTYPHLDNMEYEKFLDYWFAGHVCVLLEGDFTEIGKFADKDSAFWNDKYLGNNYIKPNYIGRCSHVCNSGFLVNTNKRGLGLGKELGRKYLQIAPQIGYVYSVFNLVFETNVASLKIWDSLGFERIGYVKNVAVLKGMDKLVGAHMFGYDFLEAAQK